MKPECQSQILSLLPAKELLKSASVCRSWRALTWMPSLWTTVDLTQFRVNDDVLNSQCKCVRKCKHLDAFEVYRNEIWWDRMPQKGGRAGEWKVFRNGDGNISSGQATNTKSTGQTTNTNSSVQTTNTYSSGQIDKREIHKARDKRHLHIARDNWPLTNTNFILTVEVVLDHHLMLWAQNLSFLSLVFFAELQFGYSRCRLDMEIRGPSYPIYYLWKWNEIVYV